jgi:hypothetical protein
MQWTKDYEKFQFFTFNREVKDWDRVERIKEVIKSDGFLVPILVNQDFYVIDGQHRLKAAQGIGCEISYIQYEMDNDKVPLVISKLNSTSKGWSLSDFLIMWEGLKKEPYEWLTKVMNEYKVPFAHMYRMCGGSLRGGGRLTYNFKNGLFNASPEQKEKIIEKVKWYVEIRTAFPKFSEFGIAFPSAIAGVVCNKNYDQAQMMKAIQAFPALLLRAKSASEYALQMEEMYNRDLPIKKRLRFSKNI